MKNRHRDPVLPLAIASLAILLAGADRPVKFDRYDDYSEKNAKDQEDATSCLAITNRKAFDDRFGVPYFGFGTESKAPTTVPDDAFKDRMVVAVVKRGHAFWTYDVQGVAADGDKLTLRYKTTKKPQPGTTYACPLVVLLPKGDFRTVTFIEDGKEVGKAGIEGAKKP